jgi:S-disulfanyl-L-cysteine oxidoreductase SoxD
MLTKVKRAIIGLCVAGAVGATAAGVLVAVHAASAPAPVLADAEDNASVELGKSIYRRQCASCHGRYLQGQPLWQINDEDAGRRAPAHDESGHTWQHSDRALFQMTKHGRFASALADAVSHMPAFKDVLSDADILAVIAFIKRRWPLGLRISQAMLNPGYAGMPPDASRVAWKLPPTCMATVVRRTSSR